MRAGRATFPGGLRSCSIVPTTPTSTRSPSWWRRIRSTCGRWEAVVAVARLAEGVATEALLAIWYEWQSAS